MPCGSNGECRANGLAVPDAPRDENRFEPTPEGSALRSDPRGRLRTLLLPLADPGAAELAEASAGELDFVASEDVPAPPVPALGR